MAKMNYKSNITFYFLLILFKVLNADSDIYKNIQDTVTMCTFNQNMKLKDEVIQLRTHDNKIIYLSPCNKKIIQSNCVTNNTLICLKDLENPEEATISLGESFKVIEDEDRKKKYKLLAESMVRCKSDPEKYYTTKITFNEGELRPYVIPTENECEFHIKMPDSSSAPSCMTRVNGYLLDFRKFTNDFTIRDGNDTFTFNLCKPTRGCTSSNAASCVRGSRNEILGNTATRRIAYNDENGDIEFNFYFGPKRGRIFTKVKLICNWDAKTPINPKRLNIPGKTTKFTVDSVLGCIKLPMDCKFKDIQNYEYDLSPLYRKNRGWTVANDKKKSIQMNICGPLSSIQGVCKDQYSQICEKLGQKQLNYGSIFADKRTENGIIKAKLLHGSVCPKNSSLTLSTNLEFRCSGTEKGPKLFNVTDCGLDVIWDTPTACPTKTVVSNDLNIHDALGRRELNDLCDVSDRTHKLNPTSYITYNLCTPLHTPCNNVHNVSACLYNKKKQAVLGSYKEEKLYSRNGILSMEFAGEGCKQLNIYFVCDFLASVTGDVEIKTIKDNCEYAMYITTPLACASKRNLKLEDNCVLYNNTLKYDLTGLALTNKNYEYSTSNVEYIINVCNPLVTNPKALQGGNVAASIYNKTEPNIKRRFYSIGAQSKKLTIENDTLALKFEDGHWCQEYKNYAKGIIYFKCSSRETGPILASAKNCYYTFIWESPKACPKPGKKGIRSITKCTIPVQNQIVNLTTNLNTKFELERDGSNFIFDICQDNYTIATKNGKKQIEIQRILNHDSIEYSVNDTCENGIWNKVMIQFNCNKDIDSITYTPESINSNCIIQIKSESSSFCSKANQEPLQTKPPLERILGNVINATVNILNDAKHPTSDDIETPPMENNKEKLLYVTEAGAQAGKLTVDTNICKISIASTTIVLNELPFTTILSHKNNTYTFGYNNSNECRGYICRNKITLVSSDVCPHILIENFEIQAYYNNISTDIGLYNTTVIFKCNLTMEYPTILEETSNSVKIYYPMDKFCILQKSDNMGLIIGTAVAIVVISLIIVISVLYRRKCDLMSRYMPLLRRGSSDKSNLHVYCRDARL